MLLLRLLLALRSFLLGGVDRRPTRAEVKVGGGHGRFNGGAPRDKLRMQFLRAIRLGHHKVLPLANVLAQIIELDSAVLEELHQLPIACVYQTDGHRTKRVASGAEVSGEMLVKGFTCERLPRVAPEWHEAFTVENLRTRKLAARDLGEGGIKIDVNRRHVAR